MKITVELPIYVQTTKNKTKLIGMNWYRNTHFHEESKTKRYYHELVSALLKLPRKHLTGVIKTSYKLYYKNSQSDLMNIVSVIDKYLLDALQEIKIIDNDNVLNYRKCEIEVVGQDKKNPRLICEITGEDDE
jgi:hypothetical protein|nr:MAG TPA_asm: Endodeoxyribonuclease RusA [Caudoviricetes sp.]